MGLLFLGDEHEDFSAMIEEIAQRVEDLGLGDLQVLGDLQDRFAAPMRRSDMAHGNSQPVNDGLASANAIKANDVGVLRLDRLGHLFDSGMIDPEFSTNLAAGNEPDQSNRKNQWERGTERIKPQRLDIATASIIRSVPFFASHSGSLVRGGIDQENPNSSNNIE